MCDATCKRRLQANGNTPKPFLINEKNGGNDMSFQLLLDTQRATLDTGFKTFGNGETRFDLPQEVGTLLETTQTPGDAVLEMRFENDQDLFKLLLIDDVLVRLGYQVTLAIYYFPYARMDRIQEDMTAFSLKVFTKLINQLESVVHVCTYAAHSDVCLIETNRVTDLMHGHYNFYQDVLDTCGFSEHDVLVFPDAGAQQRFGQSLAAQNLVVCEKVRDFKTGRIQSVHAHWVQGQAPRTPGRVFIVDDICSYGGTFLGVKDALIDQLSHAEWHLVVAHAEDVIEKGSVLDHFYVHTTDSLLSPQVAEAHLDRIAVTDLGLKAFA